MAQIRPRFIAKCFYGKSTDLTDNLDSLAECGQSLTQSVVFLSVPLF